MTEKNGRKQKKALAAPIAGDASREMDVCYEVLFRKSPAILHCSDQTERLVDVSAGWLEAFGYERDDVIGQKARKFMMKETRDSTMKAVRQRMMETGHVRDFPLQVVKKNGEVCHMLLSAVLESAAEGKLIRTLGVMTPAAESSQAEEALRESEERFRMLASASGEGIAIHEDGRIVHANEALARMYGYELSEVIGTHVHEYAAPESRDLVLERIRSGDEGLYYAVGSRKNGSTFPVEIHSKNVRYQGKMARITVIRNISQQKEWKAPQETQEDSGRRILRGNPYRLTAREITVLHLVASGKTDKQIAGDLGISPLTVHKHVANILGKMDASSRTQAGVRALREGLLS